MSSSEPNEYKTGLSLAVLNTARNLVATSISQLDTAYCHLSDLHLQVWCHFFAAVTVTSFQRLSDYLLYILRQSSRLYRYARADSKALQAQRLSICVVTQVLTCYTFANIRVNQSQVILTETYKSQMYSRTSSS